MTMQLIGQRHHSETFRNFQKPSETFRNFSFTETNGSFKSEWFKWFLWLHYSPSEDAVYCLACILFHHEFPEKASRVKNVYSQPFRQWPAPVSACKVHAEGKVNILMNHANQYIAKHGLFLVIPWLI